MTVPFAPRRLTIATRESALALWQAEHVRGQLASRYHGTTVELLGVTTQGDRIVDRPLATIGGKGLFIKELETALAEWSDYIKTETLAGGIEKSTDIPPDVKQVTVGSVKVHIWIEKAQK